MNERMQSAEDIFAGCDESRNDYLSDRGAGAEKVYRRLDITFEEELAADEAAERCRDRRLEEARNRLLFLRLERLIPVLDAIVKNGKDWQKSVDHLMRKLHIKKVSAKRVYFRDVATLSSLINELKVRP